MKPIFLAFLLTAAITATLAMIADMRERQRLAAESVQAVKAELSPYERDRREAARKAKELGLEKFVEDGR